MQERYRVFFHAGDELGLKSRVLKGRAWIDDGVLNTSDAAGHDIRIAASEIRSVKMFRLHGLGRVIQVDHRGGRLFLASIRLMIGQFAFINFFRTGKLHRAILDISAGNRPVDGFGTV
jgi:hypothetical protein